MVVFTQQKNIQIALRNIKEKDNIIKIVAEFDDSAISDLSVNKTQLLHQKLFIIFLLKLLMKIVIFLIQP